MKRLKRSISFVLTVLLALGLTACGPKFDASAYVKATLDAVTRNDVEKYMEITKASKEEAEKVYSDNLKEVSSMLDSLNLPEEVVAGYEDFMKKVLAKTKYNVLEAKETENGYAVDVEVEPLKAFTGAGEAIMTKAEEYTAEISEEIANGGEEPTEEEIAAVLFEHLIHYLNDSLENAEYGEKVTVTVNIEKNADNLYEITADSFTKLDGALIDISDLNFE